MRVLITGAAGCVGRQLAQKVAKIDDFSVFATDVKESPFQQDTDLQYCQFDICSEQFRAWVAQIKPDVVVHLASILQISDQMPRQRAYQIDVVATERLLETCVQVGVSKFIVTTSGAAYGYFPENRDKITEQRSPKGNPDYFYSAHKAEVEALMASFSSKHPELKQIVFRPGAILGPGFEGPVVNLFQQNMILGLLGYPGPFNFIWSEDLVDWIIEGITGDITGQFNVAGDGELSMKEIAQQLGKPYLALPAWLVQGLLTIAKPLGLTQYGPEQVKFIKYRPVLANDKLKQHFTHKPRYTSVEALHAFLASLQGEDNGR